MFRADAGSRIGYGHLSRCLALADALEQYGVSCLFALRERSRPAVERVLRQGHQAVVLKSPEGVGEASSNPWLDGDWKYDARQMCETVDCGNVGGVVVDQYGLDYRWERFVRRRVDAPIAVVDGVADRRHDCELLVDPTYSAREPQRRWRRLVPSRTRLLVGPKFALLRPEFTAQLARQKPRSAAIENILVAFGGSDAGGATELVVDAIASMSANRFDVNVVAGVAKPNVHQLRRRCDELEQVTLHVDTDEMARLMGAADLAVGAGGTMMWERAFLRLPAIVVAIAENQVEIARRVAGAGAVRYLGRLDDIDAGEVVSNIEQLMANPDEVMTMIEANEALFEHARQVGTSIVAGQLVEIANKYF